MPLIKWDPFSEIEEMFRGLTVPSFKFREIAVEQYDENGKHIIKADMPGMEAKDIEVNVKDGYLEIKALKKEEEEEKKKRSYYRMERSASFYRALPLPEEVETQKVDATLENGTLTVVFPLKEAAEPKVKKIAVKEVKKKK